MFALFKTPATAPCALGLALLIVLTPLSHVIAQADVACLDGEARAEMDISGSTWFVVGCLAGLIGYLIAMQDPYPPATVLLGKSPEYVAAYTDCYRRKGREIKTGNALKGMLALYAIEAACGIVLIVLLSTVEYD